MLKLTQRSAKKKCPLEQETVHFLPSMYASTGESFGITKTLDSYSSEFLEYLRVKPSLFHGVYSHLNYVTPTLFLKESGQLHVQMDGEAEESSAFVSQFKVPLNEWCQISVMLHGRTVTLSMVCMDKEQRTVYSQEYVMGHAVVLDDT
ncbi:Protein sel-1 like 3 [Dissostichus eleginoides]|uniref:Protein sel-1 like 3 n=1 Tax=Dissostichus eleginoides TaxID=100907 RepID=A0AAD9CFM3_DISEL|nr:Protein sel-1 like 3 [Dissostichus eleginoides]